MNKKKLKKYKIILYLLPVFALPILLMFFVIISACGTEPISPPATENKALEYQKECSVIGVPWDVVLLVDAFLMQSSNIESINTLNTALEFAVLEEQKYTITEETVMDENEEEQIIQYKTLTECNVYTGKAEILGYIGLSDVGETDASSLFQNTTKTAEGKSTESVSYEVVFKAVDNLEDVLRGTFKMDEETVENIMKLHSSRYIIQLYNGSETINIQIEDCSETEQTVWSFLKTIGFNDIGAAAVMGNVKVESSFNPAANHNNHYFGLCQWGGQRWQGNQICLTSFACQCGTEWYDLETQLNYFNLECSTSYNSVYMQMKSATELIYATDYFCTYYEGCIGELGNWAYSEVNGLAYQCLADRRAYAQAYYQKFAGK